MSSPRSDGGEEPVREEPGGAGHSPTPATPDVSQDPATELGEHAERVVELAPVADDSPSPPAERALYSAEQQRVLRLALAAGTTLPACPACGGAMTRRPIGGGSFGLGYARRREWLLCAGCHRSAIFDVRRGTRT